MALSQRIADIVLQMLGPVLRAHEDRILSTVSQILSDRDAPTAHQGFVAPGSFDPSDGTVEVIVGSTYGLIGDDGDMPSSLKKVPLFTSHIGDLSAPVGGERVVLHRDFGASLHHDNSGTGNPELDDSPGAAANGSPGISPGERIIAHRNPKSFAFDAYRRFTNDGPSSGDGLAGIHDFSGALHRTETAGGHQIVADDTAKTVTVKSASGHSVLLDDGGTKVRVQHSSGSTVTIYSDGSAEIAAPTIFLGGNVVLGGKHGGGGMGFGSAVVRQGDLQSAIFDVQNKTATALSRCQPGNGVGLESFATPTASLVSHTV